MNREDATGNQVVNVPPEKEKPAVHGRKTKSFFKIIMKEVHKQDRLGNFTTIQKCIIPGKYVYNLFIQYGIGEFRDV